MSVIDGDRNDYITNLISRLQIEFEKGDRSGVYGYTQRTLAYNSNRIEGGTLTVEQTATLFDTQTIKADGGIIRTKDIEEMTGHFIMFNYMLKTIDEPLSQELIKKFHYNLKVGVFEDMANGYPCGEYKNRVNIVSDIDVTHPKDVAARMSELLEKYHSKKDIKLSDLAIFHAEYERIHPFQDGNGRTGRLILFRECIKNSIVPLIIRNENKAEYQNTLHEYQMNGNSELLNAYFYSEQEYYYNKTVEMISPIDLSSEKVL